MIIIIKKIVIKISYNHDGNVLNWTWKYENLTDVYFKQQPNVKSLRDTCKNSYFPMIQSFSQS